MLFQIGQEFLICLGEGERMGFFQDGERRVVRLFERDREGFFLGRNLLLIAQVSVNKTGNREEKSAP